MESPALENPKVETSGNLKLDCGRSVGVGPCPEGG